jgi:hypothetical protein
LNAHVRPLQEAAGAESLGPGSWRIWKLLSAWAYLNAFMHHHHLHIGILYIEGTTRLPA